MVKNFERVNFMGFTKYKLGVIPSPQDERDFKVSMFFQTPPQRPDNYRIPYIPGVYDQGDVGQCVAFALAGIKESQEWKERGRRVRYASSFIYGNRTNLHYQGEGMVPRQALSMLVISGVPEWDEMPWIKEYPECRAYVRANRERLHQLARPQRIEKYFRIDTPDDGMTALLHTGNPFMYCIAVYPSFFEVNPVSGIVPDVRPFETILGYHAMKGIGWQTIADKRYWLVHNSWSDKWGKGGFCLIPFDYAGADEMWGLTDHDPRIPPKKQITLRLDSREVDVNGIKQLIEVAPVLLNGRTMVPIRFISEVMGFKVHWDQATKTVTIVEP
jgi:hypothetical protein